MSRQNSLVFALCAIFVAGCPRGEVSRKTGQRVRIRTFTDAVPVGQLAVVGDVVLAGTTDGIDRWKLGSAERAHFDSTTGLVGQEVLATAVDVGRTWVWLATTEGLTRYDGMSDQLFSVPRPPRRVDIGSLVRVALAADGEGGVWVGTDNGLFRFDTNGKWSFAGLAEPVTSLTRTADGLWVGGPAGLRMRTSAGELKRIGKPEGCDVAAVRALDRAPDDGVLVVGDNAAGEQRIARCVGGSCDTFRVSPEERWDAVSTAANATAVLGARGVYQITVATGTRHRLARDGVRLLPAPPPGVAEGKDSPYQLRRMTRKVPIGARSIAQTASEVLIGTRDLGVARIPRGGGRRRWLRRRSFAMGATLMSLGCTQRDVCFLAMGTGQLWQYDGSHFTPAKGAPDNVTLVSRNPLGGIYALFRAGDDFGVARLASGVWQALPNVAIGVGDKGKAEITFARFSPTGILWLGLSYRDGEDQVPNGVALVDVGLGAVSYHRVTGEEKDIEAGMLPVPIGSRDVSFLGESEVWLATTQGAAQLRGTEIKTHGEADGLESELLRGVACTSGGLVFVSSQLGVGNYDGDKWRYPKSLRGIVNDIDIGPDGRLWMATNRGLASYDGAKVRRLDSRRGLAEDKMLNLLIDQFGRIWMRGQDSIAVVVP